MNRKDSAMKATRIITVSFCDDDIDALSRCIDMDETFPPTPAELVKVLARGQMHRLLKGDDQLKHLYELFGKSPVRVQEVRQ